MSEQIDGLESVGMAQQPLHVPVADAGLELRLHVSCTSPPYQSPIQQRSHSSRKRKIGHTAEIGLTPHEAALEVLDAHDTLVRSVKAIKTVLGEG